MAEYGELRRLASAATPKPWKAQRGLYVDGAYGFRLPKGVTTEDARYIAAASPDVILALLDERDRLQHDSDLQGFQVAMLMDSRHRAHPDNGVPGDECADCRTEFDRISAEAEDALIYARGAAMEATR